MCRVDQTKPTSSRAIATTTVLGLLPRCVRCQKRLCKRRWAQLASAMTRSVIERGEDKEKVEMKVKLLERSTMLPRIGLMENASELQLAIREGWMSGK